MTRLNNFWRDEQGQDIVEYTLLLAGMAIGTAAILVSLQPEIGAIWNCTSSAMVSVRTP